MDKKIDRDLLARYVRDECNAEELEQVRQFLFQPEWKQALEELLEEDFAQFSPVEPEEEESRAWNRRFQEKHIQSSNDRSIFRRMRWSGYAAAVALFIISAVFVVVRTSTQQSEERLAEHEEEVLPGSDKAILMLSDGNTVSLSDVANGKLTEQGGVEVEKTTEGEIVYKARAEVAQASNTYNSVMTPNGGQYRITLPDGSKAWLNAASSLTYPVRFPADERRVKMTGEVYFEVAKVKRTDGDGNVPFFVETDKQEISVLGTKFNVNAYVDEPYLKTMLVEGSVKVTAFKNGQSTLLKPGQQALLSDVLMVQPADIDQQLGWQRGDFVFKGESLESVLRHISRWYDVETQCPPYLGKLRFAGIVSRSKPLSSLIKIMESTNDINITLHERRLIVTD